LLTKLGMDDVGDKQRLVSFAAGALVGNERGEVKPLLKIARKGARNLREAERFWC
jgi:hypothetical protein